MENIARALLETCYEEEKKENLNTHMHTHIHPHMSKTQNGSFTQVQINVHHKSCLPKFNVFTVALYM